MSDIGILRSLALGIPDATTRRIVTEICEELCGKTGMTFGDPDHQTRAKNFTGFFQSSTTAAVADQEFSIAHGLGNRPRVMWQVMDPLTVGSKTVRLEVSRAADTARVYLKSPETNAAIRLYVEA